jgi:hypothetical protein
MALPREVRLLVIAWSAVSPTDVITAEASVTAWLGRLVIEFRIEEGRFAREVAV